MTDGIAFSSSAPEVLEGWEKWKAHVDDVRQRRDALRERYGRGLMVNRLGFGHGTRVVGFAVLAGEEDGLLIGDNGEIRIPKKGPPYNTAVPNIRRKAGKELEAELRTLNENGPELPGMPPWQMIGLRVCAPALFEHEGTVWTRWADEEAIDAKTGGTLDLSLWTRQPLSAYYTAEEQKA